MAVLACLTLMMPYGALSWVTQGTGTLPAPHLVTPLSKSLRCVHWDVSGRTLGGVSPDLLPSVKSLRDVSAGSVLSPGAAQPCTAPGGQGALEEEQESRREESQACLKGSLLAGGLVSIIC